MPRPRKLVKCKFLPYFQVRTGSPPPGVLWLDVSSSGESPLDQFSPFFPHGGIPIPGMESKRSDSVEGIWQGLKVIRGGIAARFFEGGGQKRVGKPRGHQFGHAKRLLGLEEARRKIYIPAYEWMLDNCIAPAIIDGFVDNAFRGVPQLFYDREDNGSIGKDAPLAHAKVLVDYINRKIDACSGV
ncbi:DUF6939 family protein [Rhodopirellula islandica]|uniref:DUF6939 family protein n=1 Tax=Rhodopirellula islandica TaxID=595434 RepID=UPI000A7C3A30|nr:hypothetical protein [Rhodopirellula islandica]